MVPRDVAAHESRVRTVVLRRLLGGASLDVASLSRDAGLSAETVVAALTTLNAAGAIYLADGTVAAAYPFSAVPTPHRIRYDHIEVYACCAVDALAVPSMVDNTVTIESRCAFCDDAISVQMTADRILSSRPPAPLVFHAGRDGCEAGPTVLTRCPRINFFCGSDHAHRWRDGHPGVGGDVLTLSETVARAREIFASTIALVRGEDVAAR